MSNDALRITNEKQLAYALSLPKAIVYLQVDWSGHERLSRPVVFKAFQELEHNNLPCFILECCSENAPYTDRWLLEEKEKGTFSHDGYGETLLTRNGRIVDHIKYPGQAGLDDVLKTMRSWLQE